MDAVSCGFASGKGEWVTVNATIPSDQKTAVGDPGEIGNGMRDRFQIMDKSGRGDERIAQFHRALLLQANSLVEDRTET